MDENSKTNNIIDPELVDVIMFLTDNRTPSEAKTKMREIIRTKGCPLSKDLRRLLAIAVLLMMTALDYVAYINDNLPLIVILTLTIGLLLAGLMYDLYTNK